MRQRPPEKPRKSSNGTARDRRRRTLGQNFIHSKSVAREFVDSVAVRRDDLVIEIGAGGGVVTEQLARRTDRLVALEVDPDWAAKLREAYETSPNVSIVQGDARKFRWPREPYRVASCVPFGITTDLFHVLLDNPRRPLQRADLIVQYEVGRKRATPGRSTALGLSWEPWFSFRFVRRIPASVFRPVPSVDAAYIEVVRRTEPLLNPGDRDAFTRFVRESFSQGGMLRAGLRKQLTNNQVRRLRSVLPFTEETRCSSFGVRDWVTLFEAARDFLP